jgi:hypothetical protein
VRQQSVRFVTVALSTDMIGAICVAHAVALGTVTSKSLASFNSATAASTPTVLTCDNFSLAASTGSALNARPVQLPARCGTATWATNLGTWTITSGQLSAATTNATATIPAGQTDVSAQATVINANGTSRSAGVAIDHTGTTRIYLAASLSGGNTAQLLLVNGSSVSTLASAAATIGASAVVRITRVGTAVTVSVNGAQVLTATLTSAQVTTLSGGTKVGLYWNSGSTIRFTDILATQASAP